LSAEPDSPPLAGTLVLSVGHTLPGLYCMAALRDLGALVVRIERHLPTGQQGPYVAVANDFPTRSMTAGTHRLALDLKHPAGADAFRSLAQRADVVMEGLRPGATTRLGIDYETLSAEHPALVYLAISGYGQHGPHSDRVGHDINYLAETGVVSLASPPGLPGVPLADGMAGLSAALNIVAALHGVARTGKGQMLDCAIVDGPLFLMASELEHCWRSGESRRAGDTHLTGRYPWYGVHATADERAVAVGAIEPSFHAAFCRGIGHPELEERQYEQDAPLDATREQVAAFFSGHTREEAVDLFAAEDACVSPVLDPGEVAGSALIGRALRRDASDGERLVRSPVRLAPAALPAEKEGVEVLAELGFSREATEALVRAGALADES
jgi:crotonobetainyl-CoA:carnitine CoA-transferase CaiB-like acyl-CoA transferase